VNLPDRLFPQIWYWIGYLVFVPLLVRQIWRAPWSRLRDPALLNCWLGTVTCLLLLWQIDARIQPGITFHLLGATIFTLMFGPELALVGLAIVVGAAAAWGTGSWQSLGLNGLTMAAVPVAVSYTLYRLIENYLPNHVFIYIFVTGFAGAGAAVSAVGLATVTLLAGAGAYPAGQLFGFYLPYYLLLAWSEAFLTGMAMTLFVVYKPKWVSTFDDGRYLRNK